MMKLYSNLLKSFFLILVISGCNTKEIPQNFDYGSVENGVYHNSFFNLEINIPDGWVVQSAEKLQEISDIGKDAIAGNDENIKAAIKASEVNTANLLGIFQYPDTVATDFNSSMMIVAENVQNHPNIRSGNDYLLETKKLLNQSQIQFDYVDDEFEKETIKGVEFHKMNTMVAYLGTEIRQCYYSTILQGFSFNIIITYVSDEQKNELLKSINSLKFQ